MSPMSNKKKGSGVNNESNAARGAISPKTFWVGPFENASQVYFK